MCNTGDDAVAEEMHAWSKKHAAKEPAAEADCKTEPPSVVTLETMTRDMGIRYVAAVDPGEKNCAVCVMDLAEFQIVYWRVFALSEVRADYEEYANIHAITWFCTRAPASPLARAHFVVVEHQAFRRDMRGYEAAFHAALVGARELSACATVHVDGRKRLLAVPRCVPLSAVKLKAQYGSLFGVVADPSSPTYTRKRNTGSKRDAAGKPAFGVGDANRKDADGAQYKLNKTNAKHWGALFFDSLAGLARFRQAATRSGFMTHEQVTQTTDRLHSEKSDDLYDAAFMCFHACDFSLPRLWFRMFGPRRDKKRRLMAMYDPDKAENNAKAREITDQSRVSVETLLTYAEVCTERSQHLIECVRRLVTEGRPIKIPRATKDFRSRVLERADATSDVLYAEIMRFAEQ